MIITIILATLILTINYFFFFAVSHMGWRGQTFWNGAAAVFMFLLVALSIFSAATDPTTWFDYFTYVGVVGAFGTWMILWSAMDAQVAYNLNPENWTNLFKRVAEENQRNDKEKY